ncbi:M20/M25/M40 family metallo-hydrolase [bacterium]|nr:M20/M25/M40 family metallo-hydrolase [Euryarchaeota archaeon]MBT4180766.1 M20/M25/M40 family metallo-hydrolase [Euryarchaeota archaeon]MBT6071833.1 M20/M25/M40 family metallo-hydrolase [Euryarchaeota archaeon]MBT6075564.1 M20/M25/M40 family metallo-hydrolase [Euryarchaeota archaeon]MBT6777830.1 M20/M25/M40 family metallo-hydrolase [bacterium]
MGRTNVATLLVLLMISAPLSGCFSSSDSNPSEGDLSINISELEGGFFQDIEFSASTSMSVFIPYLIIDPNTGYVQNSTVIDISKGEIETLSILAPPRIDSMAFLIGELGRDFWPIREQGESWQTWMMRGGSQSGSENGIERVPPTENNTYITVNDSLETGGPVAVKFVDISRIMSVSREEGGVHSSGILHGKIVYDRLHEITDPTDSFDIIDGKEGYYDRWAGQGNPAYEDAAQYLVGELTSFGLEVKTHRYEFTDILGSQNPEAYNICAYKWGSEVSNEWLVFGAHFDVAPPANAVLLDPHIIGERTYGTRVGAYDNTAGTSMVLETAKALADFESRRTMVFCLWSGEEGGKRGSDYWTEYYVKEDNPEVTITNYINLDMAGVNWPGGGGAPHGDPDPALDEDGYPKDAEVWPMRVYIGPGPNHDKLDQPGMVGLSNWIGSDALGLEEEMGTLVGTNYSADTWKTSVWQDMDRPEIIVYEDTTARSDHASFQDNLGVVTVGFGGLVDGYWCYHQVCDTLEEMEQWMDTTGKNYGEENTGVANLVNSLDMITWWALMTFFHCDEKPVLNSLV